MRLTREESREQTRERLIEAAKACLIRKGYEGASIGDIAEEAGFTKGAFFSNFESKEALLLEILRRHKADEIDRMAAISLDEANTPVSSPALERYIDRLDIDCGFTLLDIQLELQASRNPAFAVQYAEVEQVFRSGLAKLLAGTFERAGRTMPGTPAQLADIMLALTRGLVLGHVADPRRPPFSHNIKLVLWSLLMSAAPSEPGPAG